MHICVASRLFDGIAEVADTLDKANRRWGIVTNKCYTCKVVPSPGLAGVSPVNAIYMNDPLVEQWNADAIVTSPPDLLRLILPPNSV